MSALSRIDVCPHCGQAWGRPAPAVSVTVPVRLVSESNAHEHWRKRTGRAGKQRPAVVFELRRVYGGTYVGDKRHGSASIPQFDGYTRLGCPSSVVVTITRIAPRKLDRGNIEAAAKHVQDGIADWLGLDDRDGRIRWEYEQATGAPGEYAVRVDIRRMGRDASAATPKGAA